MPLDVVQNARAGSAVVRLGFQRGNEREYMTARYGLRSFVISKVFTRALRLWYGSFPHVIRVESTNYCNSNCIMCPHSRLTRPKAVMSVSLFRKIVDECAAHGLRKMHLHNFGEPLLDDTLAEKLRIARDAGIGKIKLFTNGSLLTGDRLDALLDAPPNEIKISIDGATKKTFESIRVGLDYDAVCRNVLALMEAKRRRAPGLGVILTWVTVARNRDEVDAFRRQWRGKVDGVVIEPEHNWASDAHSDRNGSMHACLRPFESMTILATGKVSLCCMDWDGTVDLGDVTTQRLEDIWRGERFEEIRRAHMRRDFSELAICRNCSKIY